jgi:hypothetical protein
MVSCPVSTFPEWPVCVFGADPAHLTLTVSVEERRYARLRPVPLESK